MVNICKWTLWVQHYDCTVIIIKSCIHFCKIDRCNTCLFSKLHIKFNYSTNNWWVHSHHIFIALNFAAIIIYNIASTTFEFIINRYNNLNHINITQRHLCLMWDKCMNSLFLRNIFIKLEFAKCINLATKALTLS